MWVSPRGFVYLEVHVERRFLGSAFIVEMVVLYLWVMGFVLV